MWWVSFFPTFWFWASWGQGRDTRWPPLWAVVSGDHLRIRATVLGMELDSIWCLQACVCIDFLLIFFNFMAYLWKAQFRKKCISENQISALMWCSENWKVCRERGLFLLCLVFGMGMSSSVCILCTCAVIKMKVMWCKVLLSVRSKE